jgi:hypothetical protein
LAMTGNDQLDERETARRRDDALRRALNTPPQPRKPKPKKDESPAKRPTDKGRARVGKAHR